MTPKEFSDKARKEIKDALKMFGTYQYDDKGPDEVMFVKPLVEDIKNMSADDATEALLLLGKSFSRGQTLVSSIMMDLQEHPHFDTFEKNDKLMEWF